ncbi:MAG: 4'-phosphopantetheinyl transferase superfamily protein [Caulobacteraceae bacterium]|nr:4'-phosphopantetheinyl transferase superfamily protein [Caulobacter sp.]
MPLGPDAPTHASLIRFDPQRFAPSAFEDWNIQAPARIAGGDLGRQADFFYGRLAARRAGAAAGIVIENLPITASRAPAWPPGVIGSISHSEGVAVAAVMPAGDQRGFGIDVERVISTEVMREILPVVMGPGELAAIMSNRHALSMEQLSTIVFSLKEAFFKAVFRAVNYYFDFSAVRITKVDAEAFCVRLEVVQTLTEDLKEGEIFTGGYKLIGGGMLMTSFVW